MAKNILITGASSGIGAETAKYLSSMDYTVVLVSRYREKLKMIAMELKGKNYIFPFDLNEFEQMEDIFLFCRDQGIKLDGLVHCAGMVNNIPVRLNKMNVVKSIMNINYFAFIELCKHFYNRKYSNDGASIIAMSSLAAITCRKGSVPYAGSKGALNTAVNVMSKEFLQRKIRVNTIMPAYVNTSMTSEVNDFTDVISMQPLGMIEPVYIAYMIEFLLSDKAKYITGAHIPISAGMEF